MKVFLNKTIPQAGMRLLQGSTKVELIQPTSENPSKEEWLNYCRQAVIIANVGKNTFDKDFFDQCPNVKAIALFSVGYDHVAIEEATKRKIAVTNTPNVLSKATSDVAFLLMQAVARKASYNFNKVRTGKWDADLDPTEDLGQQLYGKTLGVFGLGRIGYEMAKKCKYAFDMDIIYHNRNRNHQIEKQLGAQYVSFNELVQLADVLSIHANYSYEQENLFNSAVFEQMKSNAILINTARGGFINEDDVYEALTSGKIWGAGMDVTNPEPMKTTSALLSLSNVCILPHIGSATEEARNGMAELMAQNVLAFAENREMPTIVNPEIYL